MVNDEFSSLSKETILTCFMAVSRYFSEGAEENRQKPQFWVQHTAAITEHGTQNVQKTHTSQP
jgi:hypothetical protein